MLTQMSDAASSEFSTALAVHGALAPGREKHGQIAMIGGRWRPGAVRCRLAPKGWGVAFGYPGLVLGADGELLTDLTPADIERLRAEGIVRGGMVPKLETCVTAVQSGCEAAVVLDGRVGHAMLLEFFTARGAGTLVRA